MRAGGVGGGDAGGMRREVGGNQTTDSDGMWLSAIDRVHTRNKYVGRQHQEVVPVRSRGGLYTLNWVA